MSNRPFLRALATVALVTIVWGCGSSTASNAAPTTASTQPSAAEASSAAPSSAEPSSAAPSSAASDIPSFALPSGAKDLEALLPDQLCGAKATKASMAGDQFAATADEQFKATLAALGKQPSDVAFAIAIGTGNGCTAGIFRIKGVDQNLLQQAFLAQAQKTGETYTQSSVGGKDVYASGTGSTKSYAYFKGDAVIFAAAKDEATAATILQQLP